MIARSLKSTFFLGLWWLFRPSYFTRAEEWVGWEDKQKAPAIGQLIQIECKAFRLSQIYGQMKPRLETISLESSWSIWIIWGLWGHLGSPVIGYSPWVPSQIRHGLNPSHPSVPYESQGPVEWKWSDKPKGAFDRDQRVELNGFCRMDVLWCSGPSRLNNEMKG